MPSSGGGTDRAVENAVRRGALPEAALDAVAARVTALTLAGAEYTARLGDGTATASAEELAAHHALARRAALESAILLKNEGALLPLAPHGRLALIGAFATHPRYQGSGSSKVNAHTLDT